MKLTEKDFEDIAQQNGLEASPTEVPEQEQSVQVSPTNKFKLSEEDFNRIYLQNQRKKEVDNQNLQTALESTARGLTAGLSDKFLVDSGITTQEELNERKSVNNILSTASEAAGMIAPLIVSGGTSAAANIASKTPIGAIAKAGTVTEEVLKNVMAKTGNKALANEIVKKTIAKGAGSAVEGGLLGAGTLVSEDALGNADFNAENFIAHVGLGTAFGGAIGASLPVAGVLAKGTKDALSKNFKKVIDSRFSPEKAAVELSAMTPSALKRNLDSNKNFEQDLLNFWKNDVFENDKSLALKLSQKDQLTKISDLNKAAGQEIDNIITNLDKKSLENLPKNEEIFDPIVHNKTNSDKFSAAFNKAKQEGAEVGTSYTGTGPKDYEGLDLYMTPNGKSGYAINANGELVAAFSNSPSQMVDDIFINKKAVSVKNLYPNSESVFSKYADKFEDGYLRTSGQKVDAVFEKTNSALLPKNAEVFKNLADDIEENFIKKYGNDRAFTSMVRPVRQLKNDLLEKAGRPGLVRLSELNNYRKLMQELAYKGDKLKETYKSEAADSIRAILRRNIDDIANKLDPEQALALKEANKKYYISKKIIKPLEERIIKKSFKDDLSMKDILLGGGLAGVLDPISGGLAVAGKKFLESEMLKKFVILSKVESANKAVKTKITNSVGQFLKSTAKSAKPLSSYFLVKSYFSEKDGKKPSTRKEAYQNISDKIGDYRTNPEKLEKDISKNTAGISDAAPETAAEIAKISLMSLKFLESKMPVRASKIQLPKPFSKQYVPSDLELAKLERYLQVMENPLSIMDELESGSITREHVEALQNIYPSLYQRIKEEAINQVSEQEYMPFNKKVQIGILFNTPTDESMISANLLALQANFINQINEGSGAVNSTVTGVSKLNLSDRQPTEMQKAQERK